MHCYKINDKVWKKLTKTLLAMYFHSTGFHIAFTFFTVLKIMFTNCIIIWKLQYKFKRDLRGSLANISKIECGLDIIFMAEFPK